ncbi:MAG: hypothetical protein HQ517_11215 [SAR324 cluster bacterium]|nr:hypothetical protein [SAR324 cluster bacterium]
MTDAGKNHSEKDLVKEPMKAVITIWDTIMLEHHLKILESGSLEKQFPDLSGRLFSRRL